MQVPLKNNKEKVSRKFHPSSLVFNFFLSQAVMTSYGDILPGFRLKHPPLKKKIGFQLGDKGIDYVVTWCSWHFQEWEESGNFKVDESSGNKSRGRTAGEGTSQQRARHIPNARSTILLHFEGQMVEENLFHWLMKDRQGEGRWGTDRRGGRSRKQVNPLLAPEWGCWEGISPASVSVLVGSSLPGR